MQKCVLVVWCVIYLLIISLCYANLFLWCDDVVFNLIAGNRSYSSVRKNAIEATDVLVQLLLSEWI